MASRKKGIEPERLAKAAEQLLEAIQSKEQRWGELPKLDMPEELARQARAELLKQKKIVDLGRIRRVNQFCVLADVGAKEHLTALAEEVINERGLGEGLVLLPLSKKHKVFNGVPGKVKDHIVVAARRLVDARKAFYARLGNTNRIALAENLAALLHVSPAAASTTDRPALNPPAPFDQTRVVAAYGRLAQEKRSPNVIVADLQRESGVPLEPLKEWLLSECRAHRAIPFLGEPARATEEQLAAALLVGGQRHLYVRLVEEGLS